MANPRETALKALYEIEFEGKYSNMAVKAALYDTIGRDKALVTELVYGCVRRKLTLDYIISKFSSVKLKKLSSYVLLLLRLGIYQIYFTDKIPDFSAVDESVKLAKKYCYKSSGFVNGVLRAAVKNKDDLEYPSDRNEYLSIKYSFPKEIVELFKKNDFCEELLKSLNEKPNMTLRINTLKCSELEIDGIVPEKSPLCEFAVNVSEGFDVGKSEEYLDGKYIAQDVAAMMAPIALAPKEGDLCVDVCAAPGGKTTELAALMNNRGRVVAFDIYEHKVELIKSNAARMGADIVEAYTNDATIASDELCGKADKVLADVPCSGLGIIRKKPDIKWRKTDFEELTKLQYKILEASARYLKLGGELVYSTCTLNPSENEDIVEKFIANNGDFEFVPIDIPSPLWRENKGYITFYPNIDNTDGFFIAKIKRCR